MDYKFYKNYYTKNLNKIISPKIKEKIDLLLSTTIIEENLKDINLEKLAKIAEFVDIKLEKNNNFTQFEKEAMVEIIFSHQEYIEKKYGKSFDDYINHLNNNINKISLNKNIFPREYPYNAYYSQLKTGSGSIEIYHNKKDIDNYQEYFIKCFSHELTHCESDTNKKYGVVTRNKELKQELKKKRNNKSTELPYIYVNEPCTEIINLDILKENFENAKVLKNGKKVKLLEKYNKEIKLTNNNKMDVIAKGNVSNEIIPFVNILTEFYGKELKNLELGDKGIQEVFQNKPKTLELFKDFSKIGSSLFAGSHKKNFEYDLNKFIKLSEKTEEIIIQKLTNSKIDKESIKEKINKYPLIIRDSNTNEIVLNLNEKMASNCIKSLEKIKEEETKIEQGKSKLKDFFNSKENSNQNTNEISNENKNDFEL